MTAHINRDVTNRMFQHGVKGYLIKPFDEDALLRRLSFHGRKTAGSCGTFA